MFREFSSELVICYFVGSKHLDMLFLTDLLKTWLLPLHAFSKEVALSRTITWLDAIGDILQYMT